MAQQAEEHPTKEELQQVAALRMRDALRELNRAIQEATKAELRVEAEFVTSHYQTMSSGRSYPVPVATCTVLREL